MKITEYRKQARDLVVEEFKLVLRQAKNNLKFWTIESIIQNAKSIAQLIYQDMGVH